MSFLVVVGGEAIFTFKFYKCCFEHAIGNKIHCYEHSNEQRICATQTHTDKVKTVNGKVIGNFFYFYDI